MIGFLVNVVIVLAIIAIAQLLRVFELSSTLRGAKAQHEVLESDNRLNARLMMIFLVAFFAFCTWQFVIYVERLLPVSASVHGDWLDQLFNFNMIIITFVFVVTHIVMFYFAYKYYGKAGRVATYYPHNNKLELIWTVIPAIVLAVIIIYGLKTWNKIMEPASKDAIIVEVYSKQFDWTFRYAGKDNQLGAADYKLITGPNICGVDSNDSKSWDDMVVRNELHIPKGKEVDFKIRSRDVIHSFFLPHFRAQMNAVPGMTTSFHFTAKYTTKEMREITKNDKFDYVLLCNKICGASHYNMQAIVVVDEPADYEKWIAQQKTYKNQGAPVSGSQTKGKMVPEDSNSNNTANTQNDDSEADGDTGNDDKSKKGSADGINKQ